METWINTGCGVSLIEKFLKGESSDLSLKDRPRPYQLVGEVMAHQGEDG